MYVFLDESGGLSFDFTKGGTTRFFVVCLLVLSTEADYRTLARAVERTIRHKLHKGRAPKRPTHELKGAKTGPDVKGYFYRQARASAFHLYTLVLNKARVYDDLRNVPEKLYNFVARKLLERCPFKTTAGKIIVTLDRRKSAAEIRQFNHYLLTQLEGDLPINTPFEIHHQHSWENKGLQAVDLFAWGIFRKYERGDATWYDAFKERIAFEDVYLR